MIACERVRPFPSRSCPAPRQQTYNLQHEVNRVSFSRQRQQGRFLLPKPLPRETCCVGVVFTRSCALTALLKQARRRKPLPKTQARQEDGAAPASAVQPRAGQGESCSPSRGSEQVLTFHRRLVSSTTLSARARAARLVDARLPRVLHLQPHRAELPFASPA